MPLTTQSLLASIPEPLYSFVITTVPTPEKGLKPASSSTRDQKASSCSEGSCAEGVDWNPGFKAIIPLPEEVEVKTVEEGEDVLFDQPSKLLRFVDGEWKQLGSGQLKLLQNPTTKNVQLVVTRDQVPQLDF